MTPPPTNTTARGSSRSLNTSSDVIMCSAPGIGRARGFEPVAMTMWPASILRSPTATAFGPTKLAWPRITSTPRLAMRRPSAPGMWLIICFSRSISADQSKVGLPTVIPWTFARSISCSAWPAATSTFFGVQPRLGQVPPRRSDSIIATDRPAARVGTVTPIPALPPPRMSTSYLSAIDGTPARFSNLACFAHMRWLPLPRPSTLDFEHKRPTQEGAHNHEAGQQGQARKVQFQRDGLDDVGRDEHFQAEQQGAPDSDLVSVVGMLDDRSSQVAIRRPADTRDDHQDSENFDSVSDQTHPMAEHRFERTPCGDVMHFRASGTSGLGRRALRYRR